jgi:hypothetical protein
MLHLKILWKNIVVIKFPKRVHFKKIMLAGFMKETILKIQNIIRDGPIWVGIDETTDADGRYIANVIVGKLSTESSKPFFFML